MLKILLNFLLVGWVGVSVCGCRANEAKKANIALDKEFEIFFYYRKNTSTPHPVEKKIQFKVEVQQGDIPEIGRVLKPIKVDVGEFHVSVTADINTFYLDVFEQRNKSKYVLRQLYQLDKSIKNQFPGNHGFTGLAYVNHSKTEGELQFIGKVVR